jgi:hypothetical protein
MMPSHIECVHRIRESIDELESAGIDVLGLEETDLRRLVQEHLDFLQLMLGYDAPLHTILQLIHSQQMLRVN